MSSSARALSIGPITSKTLHPPKRILSDSEDTSDRAVSKDRESKRAKRADHLLDQTQRRDLKDKEKKRRRKKKRKQSVVRSRSVLADSGEHLGVEMNTEQVASGSGPSGVRQDCDIGDGLTSGVVNRGRSPHAHGSRQHSVGLSSVTLGTPSPELHSRFIPSVGSSDKGKGRASLPPVSQSDEIASTDAAQLAELRAQLANKTDLLSRHTTLLTTLQQSLICQICLDPMHKPYALAPCGHIACHTCLVSWFRAPPPDLPPGEALPAYFRKKTCPHCRAIVTERPVEVWAVKDMITVLIRSGLADPPMNAPTSDTAASNANADPWEGIFRKSVGATVRAAGHPPLFFPDPPPPALLHQAMGIHDIEDGGVYRCVDCMHEIWDGVCSSCGRLYPGHAHAPNTHYDTDGDDTGHAEPWDDEEEEGDRHGEWIGMGPLGGFMWPFGWDRGGDETDFDDDGSADDSEGGSDLDGDAPAPPRGGRRRYSPVHEAAQEHDIVHSDEEDDGGYESSFIDDEDDHGLPLRLSSLRPSAVWASDNEDEEDTNGGSDVVEYIGRPRRHIVNSLVRPLNNEPFFTDEEEEGEPRPTEYLVPGGRSARIRRAAPRIVSSEDDENSEDETDNVPDPSPRVGRRLYRPSSVALDPDVDEDRISDMGDDDGDRYLADEVAAREREIYGDDGSVSRHPGFGDYEDYEESIDEEGGMDEEGCTDWNDDEY